jgi:adenylate kinase
LYTKGLPLKIIISGNPGVGKHTISMEFYKLLDDVDVLDINSVILKNNLFVPSLTDDQDEVDLEKSFNFLNSLISKNHHANLIIVGHLAPYVINHLLVDLTVILRRSPYELKDVYEKRAYSKNKTYDNLVSEILGIISFDFAKKFHKENLAEVETSETISPSVIAKQIIDMYHNKDLRKFGVIDWLPVIQNDHQMLKILSAEYT